MASSATSLIIELPTHDMRLELHLRTDLALRAMLEPATAANTVEGSDLASAVGTTPASLAHVAVPLAGAASPRPALRVGAVAPYSRHSTERH